MVVVVEGERVECVAAWTSLYIIEALWCIVLHVHSIVTIHYVFPANKAMLSKRKHTDSEDIRWAHNLVETWMHVCI